MPVLTVLVIDDHELHQRVARTCLERAGHRVVLTKRVSEGGDQLAATPANVVIASMTLPEDERLAALRLATAPRRGAESETPLPPPIVLLAGNADQRQAGLPLLTRGATGLIARPYEPDRLAAHVELYSLGAAPARVLIVDDSPTLRHANVATLRAAGHEVLEAADGREALALLDANPNIDMVLTDVVMPNVDGYQLVQAIRARPGGGSLPVVMLTSLDDVGSQSRAIEVGADDVLSKPIQPAELRARMRAILRLKALQQKLVARNEELAVALQLRADLTSLIVHDFKNPLSIVMGCGDMIAWDAEERGLQSIQEMATDIVNSAIRLKNFTETLLEVSRLEGDAARPKLSVFPVAEVTSQIVSDIGRLARRTGVEIVGRVAPDLVVQADRDWVYRVLQNLVDNALKYAPSSSRITLRAVKDRDGWVRVEVADQGPGIPAEHRQRIFDKFAQLKGAERKGTGLGLAFCRMAVEAHGGSIRVADGEGPGAVFAFTLPASAPGPS